MHIMHNLPCVDVVYVRCMFYFPPEAMLASLVVTILLNSIVGVVDKANLSNASEKAKGPILDFHGLFFLSFLVLSSLSSLLDLLCLVFHHDYNFIVFAQSFYHCSLSPPLCVSCSNWDAHRWVQVLVVVKICT